MFTTTLSVDTAYCKNASSKKWYKYDDHEVYDITNRDIQVGARNKLN